MTPLPSIFKKLFISFIVVIPFALFLFLRLDGITNDMSNTDAGRWHRRSANFASAIKNLNFAETYQSYHPGVTLMWISSGVELGIKAYSAVYGHEYKTLENTDGYLLIDGISKIVLVVVLFILLLLQYGYIETLFDTRVALIFVFLASVEPYYLGINRWYHLTSLETSLCFLSFLSLLIWADVKIYKYLYRSAIFLALAILTKFSSIYIVPVLLLIFIYSVFRDKTTDKKFYVRDFIRFVGTTSVVCFALFPALWVSLFTVFSKIISAGVNAKEGDYLSVVYAETNPYFYYFVIILHKLSPLTLAVTLLSLVKALIWREKLLFFTILYIITSLFLYTVSEQKIERYILTIIPAILLLCAVTLSRIDPWFRNIAFISIIIFSFYTFKTYHPIYSAYYSPLFGGPANAYTKGIYDDNGEYFAKAAQYLNQKGRDVTVSVPYNIEAFSYYYKGKIDRDLQETTDYYVVSKDSRRTSGTYGINCPTIEKSYMNVNFEAAVIYSCKNIKSEGFDPFEHVFEPAEKY